MKIQLFGALGAASCLNELLAHPVCGLLEPGTGEPRVVASQAVSPAPTRESLMELTVKVRGRSGCKTQQLESQWHGLTHPPTGTPPPPTGPLVLCQVLRQQCSDLNLPVSGNKVLTCRAPLFVR